MFSGFNPTCLTILQIASEVGKAANATSESVIGKAESSTTAAGGATKGVDTAVSTTSESAGSEKPASLAPEPPQPPSIDPKKPDLPKAPEPPG